MATLKSLYSDAVTANLPSDQLPPEPPVLGTINMSQDDAVTYGRSLVELNWTAPTLNERLPGEYLADATGAEQVLETIYDPIAASPACRVLEDTGATSGGGSTTLSAQATKGAKTISVNSTTNFSANDWIILDDGADLEAAQIESVGSGELTLKYRVRTKDWPATTTNVVEHDIVVKTITTDYTIVLSTGTITLLAGQFTSTNPVFVEYSVTLQDLDHFELYRIPGDMPIAQPATYAQVTGHGSVVLVSDAIADTETTYEETLTASENGETWTYYLFAVDDESSPNISLADAVMVETIPSIPDGLGKAVGDARVVLSWAALPGGSDANTNGFNVFRDDGATFEDATCIKVNSALIAKAVQTFDDSVQNVTNRRSSGDVPYPANGSTYSYKIESEDTVSGWTTGTKNQDSETGGAVTTASKSA